MLRSLETARCVLALMTVVVALPSWGGVLEFLTERRRRRWPQVPRRVLAFYYTWYGTPERSGSWIHWDRVKPHQHDIATSTHYPARGAYDSHDPAVIGDHIDQAKAHGVDGFICTWWGRGTFDDRAFVTVLERARAKDFTVTVYWETAPGEGAAQVDRAVGDLTYLLRRYGRHPAFLKVRDTPVIFVYGRVMGQVPLGQWPRIIERTEAAAPPGCILIADGYTPAYARLFDGVHTYNICGWVQGTSTDELRVRSRQSFRKAVGLARSNGKISCVTVIPGYDDTKIRTPGINAERRDGATYTTLWEEAMAADPDWVLITSWNEWHEGSEIEPSWEHGDTYLRLTGRFARRFSQRPPYTAPASKTPSGMSQERVRKIRRLFAGRTVALLPDFSGEAPFWLADAGISLHELTWREVVDQKRFTCRRFPVVVYAGHESYVQSLHTPEDVDKALVRYLEEGGFLVAVSSGPFPFFYNEKNRAVVSAPRFGFPVRGGGAASRARGWESPPPGVKLGFEPDPAFLPSAGSRIPFPPDGDQRWRPCTRTGLAREDRYVPFASLRDGDGRWYGDGIVFVHHRASPPRNGKNLYAWMGLTSGRHTGDILYDLFSFIGTELAADRN